LALVTVKFTSNRNGLTYVGDVRKVKIKFVLVNTPGGLFNVPANMLEVADWTCMHTWPLEAGQQSEYYEETVWDENVDGEFVNSPTVTKPV
jgi:hypothetical protein